MFVLPPSDYRPARSSSDLRIHLGHLRTRAEAAIEAFKRDGASTFHQLEQVSSEIVSALGPQRLDPGRYESDVDTAIDSDFLCELAAWLIHAIDTPELHAPIDYLCDWCCVALILALQAYAWDIAAVLAAGVYEHYGRYLEEHGATPPIYVLIMRGVAEKNYPTLQQVVELIRTGRGTQTLTFGETCALIWLVQATHQHAHPDEELPD